MLTVCQIVLRFGSMKDGHFSVRMPITLVLRLDAVAKETRRNRNQVIELLIENALSKVEDELKKGKSVRKFMP